MKSYSIQICTLLLLITGFGTPRIIRAGGVKDFAVMSADPYKWEIQRGYERLWRFLNPLNSKTSSLLKQTPFVAVDSRIMTANEVPGLAYRLGQGRSQESALETSNMTSAGSQKVRFIIVFDSRTMRPASREGVFVVDTPTRGSIGVFGGISAVYAGTR
jgi:hypothetical protein